MSEKDRAYYRRRAEEELAATCRARDPAAANAHRLLAERYAELGEEAKPSVTELVASAGN